MNNRPVTDYRLTNAVIINTRCVELLRAEKGTLRLTEQEYEFCSKLGWEMSKLFPDGYQIPPLQQLTIAQILKWAEERQPSEYLPDETEIPYHNGIKAGQVLTPKKKKRRLPLYRIFDGILWGMAIGTLIWGLFFN